MKQKILLIEDDDASRLSIVRSLSQRGYAVSVANNLVNAEEDVLARRFDAVILGINPGNGKGSGFIRGIRIYDPYLPIIVITGCDEIEIAVDAVRCGADNVLAKPIDFGALCTSLLTLLEEERHQVPQTAGRQPQKGAKESFFGTGSTARRILNLAMRAADRGAPLLITGETGTGKGLLAKEIHQNGNRSDQPFAGVNCSGLRGEVLMLEIFGAPPGKGTGNARGNSGLLEKAQGGTLFLDEIGDMDPAVQGRLLAVLQSRDLQWGDNARAPGAVHLICSSNQQLDALVGTGTFLPELLQRISATVLRIPPLRERLREFPGIVRHLLDGLRGPETFITEEAMRTLKGYRWPGNLRELKNALEQGLLLSHGARLRPEHFNWLKSPWRPRELRQQLTMSELKEQHIASVLQRASGGVDEVATRLGISRATMYRRLKQLRSKEY